MQSHFFLLLFYPYAAVLDTVGREVALMNVLQLQNNKDALIEMIKGIVAAPDGAPGAHHSVVAADHAMTPPKQERQT